jgi:hypothetical protein
MKALRGVALAALALLVLCACTPNPVPPPPPPPPTPDQFAQVDVIKALNAENTLYAKQSMYDPTPATMKAIDPTLDWGGALEVVTLQNWNPGDTVCIADKSTSGEWWALASIKTSANVGNYYTQGNSNPCWSASAAVIPATWGSSWNMVAAQDDATKRDLLKALDDENAERNASGYYSANFPTMMGLDPSVNWGVTLNVITVTNVNPSDTVCLSEQLTAGTWFAIGSVAKSSASAAAGTYYVRGAADPCTSPSPATINLWPKSW